jgi:hypothetical protein
MEYSYVFVFVVMDALLVFSVCLAVVDIVLVVRWVGVGWTDSSSLSL